MGCRVGQVRVESLRFGSGEDEPVLVATAGQDEVAGFSVEAVGADGDGHVPGAALGAVGGEGVGVVEPAGVEVGGAEVDVGVVVVEADHDACVGAGGQRCGLAVEDVSLGAGGGGGGVVVDAEHDAVADGEVRSVQVPAGSAR